MTEFADKVRSLGVISKRTRPAVKEWRTEDGHRHKATTDELNATVTEHAKPLSTEDRQDVVVRPDTIRTNIEELHRAKK